MSVKKILGGGSSSKADARSEELTQAQVATARETTAIAGELKKIGKDQWQYYLQRYRPVETKLTGMASAGVKPDYEGIDDQVGEARQAVGREYDTFRDAARRDLERYGADPDSGKYHSFVFSSRLGEAADTAGAVTRARNVAEAEKRTERKYADETTFNRRLGTMAVGTTGPDTMGAAIRGLSTSSGIYGGAASRYDARAEREAGAGGGLAGGIFKLATKIPSLTKFFGG